MSIFNPEPKFIKHIHVGEDIKKHELYIPRNEIGQIRRILRRDGDVEIVRNKMIERYAYVIASEKTDEGGTYNTISPVRNLAISAAFNAGLYEVSRMYLLDAVSEQNARLFSEQGLRYTYDVEGLDEDVRVARNRGGENIAMQRADSLSVGCGSSLVYLSQGGQDTIDYQAVSIDMIHVVYHDEIYEEDSLRATNKNSLDEASIIVLKLEGDSDKPTWGAWFGSSDHYPLGRSCVYNADDWSQIPDVGDGGSKDYSHTVGGFVDDATTDDIANPLTKWARDSNDATVPEYPFVVLYGDPSGVGLLPSTGVSLLKISNEFDVAASVIMRAANQSALGQKALTRTQGGGVNVIPESISEMVVVCEPGQALNNVGWDASHALNAQQVILNHLGRVAEAHHVPAFLITSIGGVQFPSGTALRTALQKTDNYRTKRIKLNRSSVSRRWGIEKAIINMSGDNVASDAKEIWIPGPIAWPEEPLVKLQAAKLRNELNVDDLVDSIMDVKDEIETREQAFNYLEQRADDVERITELAPSAPAQPQQAALQGGGLGGLSRFIL